MAMLCLGLSLGLSIASATMAPSCMSDSGKKVDFAYTFKYPQGYDYAYMDSDSKLGKSSHALDSSDSSISRTLEHLYATGVSHVMWNDQPPPNSDSEAPNAHAKGVLAFSGSGGIWLTHSLPHFPSKSARSAKGLWTSAAGDFGQTFLCITLAEEEIHKLSKVMKINRPVVYSVKFASKADETKYADVKAWAVDGDRDVDSMTTSVSIKSMGGQTFTVFGKSGNWGTKKDLYRDLVAPAMGELDVEGWRRGSGQWGPACGAHKVNDVSAVSFPEQEWPTMNDHSKWAVSQKGSAFCVGDINRMQGQDKRGGGTVCIRDASFARQIRNVISKTDSCRKQSEALIV